MVRRVLVLAAMASPCLGGKFKHMNTDVKCECTHPPGVPYKSPPPSHTNSLPPECFRDSACVVLKRVCAARA